MPDIKEKLVELLLSFHLDTNNHICDGCGARDAGDASAEIADHLIANGATIQKWISVEERLPDVNRQVLVHYKNGRIDIDFRLSEGHFVLEKSQGKVTHWMPLPEPPKGE